MADDEKWRVVTLDLKDKNSFIDWTHEREWRKKGDFEFDYEDAVVLLQNAKDYRKFVREIDPDILGNLKGIVNLNFLMG